MPAAEITTPQQPAKENEQWAMNINPAPVEQERLISTIAKGRGEELRISFSPYRGRLYLAARIWFRGDDGTMRPSPRGVNINLELLPEIAKGFSLALETAEAEGLLPPGGC